MPLKLNVGVSRTLGLPDDSGVGATCTLEVELDVGLLDDLESFHERVRDAYVACHQAVNDELARLRDQAMPPVQAPATTSGSDGHGNGSGPPARGSAPPATGAPSRNGGAR